MTGAVLSCFFVTDLHGRLDRYDTLFHTIEVESPAVVYVGGDLLPHFASDLAHSDDFLGDFIAPGLARLRNTMGKRYPRVFVIMGNDDAMAEEASVKEIAGRGLWEYIHGRRSGLGAHTVYGYACVPPTPFLNKDWERYDVSRYTPPGCVSPEEGRRSVPAERGEIRYATITQDLQALVDDEDVTNSVFLFHSPPDDTGLDRAALDGKMVDHVPLDVHVGSVAIRRFIEERQPLVTLHGHIHESARLTGRWHERLGRTHMFNAAHDGPELALVRFDMSNPADATRELL